MPHTENVCQKCIKRPATRRLHVTVSDNESLRVAPSVETPVYGPLWSLDVACCAPCAGEVAMLLTGQTLGSPENKAAASRTDN